jgi:hypothetical protein
MAAFTVHVPDSFVPRSSDPVNERAFTIEFHPLVQQKILPWFGVPDVLSLTVVSIPYLATHEQRGA